MNYADGTEVDQEYLDKLNSFLEGAVESDPGEENEPKPCPNCGGRGYQELDENYAPECLECCGTGHQGGCGPEIVPEPAHMVTISYKAFDYMFQITIAAVYAYNRDKFGKPIHDALDGIFDCVENNPHGSEAELEEAQGIDRVNKHRKGTR